MREICCPRVARPLEKLGLRVTRESLVKSARYAMRYARSDHGQIGALRALNLANGALRASQHSLTVKCFFPVWARESCARKIEWLHAMCIVLSTVKSLQRLLPVTAELQFQVRQTRTKTKISNQLEQNLDFSDKSVS